MASVRKRPWTHKGVTKEKWTVRYVDQGKVHRQKTFEKKKDADLFRAKVETELSTGSRFGDADKLTVEFVAEEFDGWMRQRCLDGSIGRTHHYRTMNGIRRHVLPHIGRVTLSKLNLARLTDWYKAVLNTPGISAYTARNHVGVGLKMMLDFAVRREWMARNPVPQLMSENRLRDHAPIRTFSLDELRILLGALSQPSYQGRRANAHLQMECAVHLAAFCGLRLGEIIGLKLENIDFDRGVLHVRTSLSRYDGLKRPKSKAGIRDVGLPRHVVAMLAEWRDTFYVENDMGLMFIKPNGKVHDGSNFNSYWAHLLHRAGLSESVKKPTFHFHALRHFAASFRIDAGWSLPAVAKEMGHSKIDMTMSVYAHVLTRADANPDAAQSLSDRFDPRQVTSSEARLRKDGAKNPKLLENHTN